MKNMNRTSKWNEYIETPLQQTDSSKIDMSKFRADEAIDLPKRLPEESFRSYVSRIFV